MARAKYQGLGAGGWRLGGAVPARSAMEAIARETLANVTAFDRGGQPPGVLRPERVIA